MKSQELLKSLVSLGLGTVLCLGYFVGPLATAQSSFLQVPKSSFQRSEEIYHFSTAATSGPRRGEEIYYYKCWMCHNDYTIAAGTPAPTLVGIYDRSTLLSGEPVNDETLAEKIRSGGPLMPSYRHTITDADIADLLSYLRDDQCCFDGEEPPANPRYRATSDTLMRLQEQHNLRGGPTGIVESTIGYPLEGIGVQLIAGENSIRTTVYSDEEGRYEFPELPMGSYTLRVARPLEFKPYERGSVQIGRATQLEDIVLERVTDLELLPPTPEIMAQLSGVEWMMNLPGTGQEKRVFSHACGFGCHSYQQVFRNRYDEAGWALIVDRMVNYIGSPLTIPFGTLSEVPEDERRGRSGLPMRAEIDILVKWLARVRGPNSEDAPFDVLPGPRGAATRVIVTEYELPRLLLAAHDVAGDSNGHIWYTPHRSPYIGKLDPITGVVEEYRVPDTPGAIPGTHSIWVDENDVVWMSENWASTLTSFDPRTEQFTQVKLETGRPYNAPGFGNMALAEDGYVWKVLSGAIKKIDPVTGEFVGVYPFDRITSTYGSLISRDGNFFAGGLWPGNLIGLLDTRTGEVQELETRSVLSSPAKGYFNDEGNAWFGGRGGALIEVDVPTRRTREYFPPTQYVTFYEALTDKNGEVWAGELHGGRFARLDPETERWTEYVLPEPYAHNRRTWIDNVTDPVTVWYVDHNGYMVRIQPLE